MTNLQFFLAIALPIIAVLTSLVISLIHISGIREDMRGMRSEFREDLRTLHSYFQTLTGKLVEIDNRLTRIEERLEHR